MTDDFDPYTPISCGLHSEYELAVIRRINLRLGWRDAFGQQHIGNVQPLDLYARKQVEYLMARAHDGQQHEIRLDKINSSNVREAITR